MLTAQVLFQSYSAGQGATSRCGDTLNLLLARRRDRRLLGSQVRQNILLLIYFLKASNIFSTQFVRTGNVSLTAPLVVRPAATVLQFTTDTTDSAGSLAVEVAILRSSLAG